MKRRLLKIMAGLAVGIAVALVGAWTAVGYMSTKGIEEPEYSVVEKRRGYEIREYAPYIRAEVTLEGAYRDTLYGGFRQVADYIFGNNTTSEKVAMTA
ncbi:MAG TPA: heme-binding protein, partial [Candidatus Hydrogenedentes bacterium]|nr:heme-binding protein [Candidatus Hydrogenedentota bacterium]